MGDLALRQGYKATTLCVLELTGSAHTDSRGPVAAGGAWEERMRRFSVVALILGALALIVPLRAEMVRGDTLSPAQTGDLTLMDDPAPDEDPPLVAPGETVYLDVLANDVVSGDGQIDPATLAVVPGSLAPGASAVVMTAAEAGLTDDPTTMPPEDGTPPTDETVPPTEETVPPPEETVPPTEESVPPTEETVPPTEETVPP
ncbi:MAG: hypothetical protein S0880_28340, partial [Actinomycetota bacterium]|nr:hypothetical protein [Actinomycetota bacterium]